MSPQAPTDQRIAEIRRYWVQENGKPLNWSIWGTAERGEKAVNAIVYLLDSISVLQQRVEQLDDAHSRVVANYAEQAYRAKSAEQRLEAAERERDESNQLAVANAVAAQAEAERAEAAERELGEVNAKLRVSMPESEHLAKELYIRKQLLGDAVTDPKHPPTAEMARSLRERLESAEATIASLPAALRSMFTNEVIRAIGALARQQNVCREQGGKATFVTGMEAAREYIVEHALAALPSWTAEE
jgi:hypothetical protein